MGQGMVVVTPEPDRIQKIASENGIESEKIGETSNKTANIEITSKGRHSEGKTLPFRHGKYAGN